MVERLNDDEVKDYSNRLYKIFKDLDLLVGIGGLSKMCKVPQSKIRYWEQKGYIEAVDTDKNKNRRYPYHSIIKVELIKSFLNSGYTLSAAADKAAVFDRTGSIIRKVIGNRFNELTLIDNKPAINMGPVDGTKDQYIYFIDEGNDIKTKIIKKNS
ncbi:MerR family transcriptional regulator [Apilactobacillus apisilvae]|uniref:MerR family transcriptional regulator n=1 Tax=Apilactobacillus apisilvae TaxID=2923364 RepID=A0ABY4PHS6_9LACO|nr:MerR family transcriptional regulator [Apilactobacillus apisilvae]UQS84972.1 MerR family transcriptional regulator [Apilactobacillus apisilvae]